MEPAFVLHRWPFQDSSLIVELLSREQGRFRVVAKGARRPKSQWRAILQPFTPLLITSQGRHELQTLRQAELYGTSLTLKGEALYSGFYLNELLQRLTSPYQPVEELFDDYHNALRALAAKQPIEPVLREFEWRLLCHLGHGFDWFADSNGEPIDADRHYRFIAEQGFLPVAQLQPQTFSGVTLQRLGAFELTDAQLLNSMKQIMRQALAPFIGDKPLRSRQLFSQLKRKE
ncbi:DNA repair protein RecO [Pseudidiomarina insulisalsae]|uniref:DNA repair protein RecO n=1 Tax=Pseudidiomarina insulisalsae TaxID=575789 RepID=A0A432YAI3_9GAMM|nr:DNA repair protein RecO [Pseudidiomarina insulisalsae]RUO57876.1 DNA repair protein RecO [Pseudidiomarina insulisalsae]